MTSVIVEAEENIHYKHEDFMDSGLCGRDIEKKHLIKSALHIGESLNVAGILIFTKS